MNIYKVARLYWLMYGMTIAFSPLYGQDISIQASNQTWIMVNSFQGVSVPNAFNVQIDVRGTNTRLDRWSLMARLASPIVNSEGKVMDPSKVHLRLQDVRGDGPTFQEIGADGNAIPINTSGIFCIQQSNAPLFNGPNDYYKKVLLIFDILIEGGQYLEALRSWQNYDLNLAFFLLDENGRIVYQSEAHNSMQIYPAGDSPQQPSYTIHVNGNARQGLLEFRTPNDYRDGVYQFIENGLSVNASTPYVLQVNTLTPNFESGTDKFPVEMVHLDVNSNNPNPLSGSISLSSVPQVLLVNPNKEDQTREFRLKYYTLPNDQRFLQVKPANYQVILLYTLLPQ